MRNVTLLATAAAGLLAVGGATRSQPRPADPHKGWVDYDERTFKQPERQKERPGNFRVLAAVADYFDGATAVRPDYSRCAYPFRMNGREYATWDEVQKGLDDEAAERKPRNKLRQFNLHVRSLTVHPADTFADSAAYKRLDGPSRECFTAARKRHPGRAVVALVAAELESLQSPKIETGDDPFVFYLVPAGDRWRVAGVREP